MKKMILMFIALFAIALSINAQTDKKVKPIHLTKAEFKTKVANYSDDSTEWKYLGSKPAIVDFYASWCGPCRRVSPILDKLADEFKDQIVIYKVDTDKEKSLARDLGIQSLPTLLFVPLGDKPQVAVGALTEEDFRRAISEVLLKKAEPKQ